MKVAAPVALEITEVFPTSVAPPSTVAVTVVARETGLFTEFLSWIIGWVVKA